MKDAQIMEVLYWYEGLPDWVSLSSGYTVPVNTPATIAVRSKNIGDETFDLRTYLDIISPGGGTFSAMPDVYHVSLLPGEETWIYFDNVALTALGVYTFTIEDKEYGELAVMDSVSMSITAGSSSTPTPPTTPGDVTSSVTQMLIPIMTIGIFGMLLKQMEEKL